MPPVEQDSAFSLRALAFENAAPICIVDRDGCLLDWNLAFDTLHAQPLQICRGDEASRAGIATPRNAAAADHTDLRVATKQAFVERTTACASGFPETSLLCLFAEVVNEDGQVQGWSVQLFPDTGPPDQRMWHRVISRLEGEITWSKYSAVYDALLLKFPAYRRLLRQVAEEVGEAKRCADLGAGTGNSTVALLEADPKRSVWAIDSNRFMLRRLLKKVGNRFPGRLQVQQENVERLRSFGNQMFDAVTLVNTLYAIDDPSRCLHEVRRVLSDDGRLVLTTPHADTDVPRLLASLRDALEAQGRLEVSLDAYRNVCERHQTLSEQIHQRTIAQTVELIESCGFDIQCCVPAYNDAVILVSARKRSR